MKMYIFFKIIWPFRRKQVRTIILPY
jgi:hypothetical protein